MNLTERRKKILIYVDIKRFVPTVLTYLIIYLSLHNFNIGRNSVTLSV